MLLSFPSFSPITWSRHRSAQAGSTFVPLFTQAVTQPFPGPQDNFEEVLSGNQTSLFTGQFLNTFSHSQLRHRDL